MSSAASALAFMYAINAAGPYSSQLFPSGSGKQKPCSKCSSCRFEPKGNEVHCRGSRKTLFEGCDIAVKDCDGYERKEETR
ncbi:MAG: hypothetical protein ILP16_11645 [Spirochaetales bacterium]|nr:hypothetical protein [Spirochaetales bacterium]